MPKAPCQNCTDRVQHCHSNCDKYTAFKAEMDCKREFEKQQNERLSGITNLNRNNIRNRISGDKSAIDIHITEGVI